MNAPHIDYTPGVLSLLDQTKLPATVEYLELRRWPEVVAAIKGMVVRGAPAIGIAGGYGMALAAREYAMQPDLLTRLIRAAETLAAARPTAVNLAWAVGYVLGVARSRVEGQQLPSGIVEAIEDAARKIHHDDIESCKRIGDAGARLIPDGAGILTHCNTGNLATGGYGTALGIIRSAWRDGRLTRVYVGETRPRLQGARLTAWELAQDGIPHTLITDSMAAHFMRRGDVHAVVVGADRIARNGDVANKIGTYGLAVLAREHRIPFIVAAPKSTFDPYVDSGAQIPIEERDAREVTEIQGAAIAPALTPAANPAFDVTPAEYVTAIVTELGVLRPPYRDSIAHLDGLAVSL
jgi:methylthioribose-1-phosphate isomerase